jgi:hypothetical protein
MRALVAVMVACAAACTFPQKHPDDTDAGDDDASIDAPAIDAPSIDAPAIDAPSIDAPSIDAATDAVVIDAPTDAAPTCTSCDVNARCVSVGGTPTCRCNWGYSGNGTTCAANQDNTIQTVLDGTTTTISSEFYLATASYLRSLGGVILSSGQVWFARGNTSCGDWDLEIMRFTPGVSGPTNVSTACEGEPDSPVGATIAGAGSQRVACFSTHAPTQHLRCGSVAGAPGTYTQTIDLGNPRDGLSLESSATQFAVGFTEVDASSASLGTRLARLDGNGGLMGTALPLGGPGMSSIDVGHYGTRWTAFRAMSLGPITADIVDDNGILVDTVSMAALPGATASRFLAAGSGEATQRFLFAADQEVYVGVLDDLGQGSVKHIDTSVNQLTGAVLVPMLGGYGVVYSTTQATYYLRIDTMGRVREAKRTVVSAPAMLLIGAVHDGAALWIVYATSSGAEQWDLYVRRIA